MEVRIYGFEQAVYLRPMKTNSEDMRVKGTHLSRRRFIEEHREGKWYWNRGHLNKTPEELCVVRIKIFLLEMMVY